MNKAVIRNYRRGVLAALRTVISSIAPRPERVTKNSRLGTIILLQITANWTTLVI